MHNLCTSRCIYTSVTFVRSSCRKSLFGDLKTRNQDLLSDVAWDATHTQLQTIWSIHDVSWWVHSSYASQPSLVCTLSYLDVCKNFQESGEHMRTIRKDDGSHQRMNSCKFHSHLWFALNSFPFMFWQCFSCFSTCLKSLIKSFWECSWLKLDQPEHNFISHMFGLHKFYSYISTQMLVGQLSNMKILLKLLWDVI